jgi:nitrite reductase/ring-hydroxylating ferredoxin subunit
MEDSVRTSLSGARDDGLATIVAVLSDLPERSPVAIDAVLEGQAESLILYRDGETVRAWWNVCPHAGRRLDWAPGKFLMSKDGRLICAAHGATFELGAGECVAGPCRGDALRAVAVEVVAGEVRVVAVGG